MAEVAAASDADAGSTLREWTRKVPEEVVEVGRFDGTWVFNIKFEDSVIPPSLFTLDNRDDQLALNSSKFIDIWWEEQWMQVQDIPEDLGRDGILELARTLETMIDASEDVIWSLESSSYAVGDNRRKHICLEWACLNSKGTQCPSRAIGEISQQLADRVSASNDRRGENSINAAQYLAKLVQDTQNSYPNGPSRVTAAVLSLASFDNPLRRLMRD